MGYVVLVMVAIPSYLFIPGHRPELDTAVVMLAAVNAVWARTPFQPLKCPPRESIAEHCQRARAWWMRMTVPAIVAWIMTVRVYVTGIEDSHKQALMYGGALVLAALSWALYLRQQLCCPRCGTNLRNVFRISPVSLMRMEQLGDVCPGCRVSLEEPWAKWP